jgi:hypothetical protein
VEKGVAMLMKKAVTCLALVLLLAVLFGAHACAGTVTASGEMVTWDMVYDDFNRLEIGSAFDVTISCSDTYLVRIIIDKALNEYLNIDQRGDTLRIALKPNYAYLGTKQQAVINLPDLRRLELSGASKAVVSGFSVSHSLDFALSGASRLDLGPTAAGNSAFSLSGASWASGNIEMDNGSFKLSGASLLELQGAADDITVDASGASSVKLSDFPVLTADVHLSGASNAVVSVSTRMDVNLSGASDLKYIGSPKLGKLNMSGASTISQVE